MAELLPNVRHTPKACIATSSWPRSEGARSTAERSPTLGRTIDSTSPFYSTALADDAFEFGQGLGDRRLGQELFGGAAEVALPGHHDEAVEVAQADAGEEALGIHKKKELKFAKKVNLHEKWCQLKLLSRSATREGVKKS